MNLPNLVKITGNCRRTFIALVSILGMFVFGYLRQIDVTNSVASIAIALAGANAVEGVMSKKKKKEDADENSEN